MYKRFEVDAGGNRIGLVTGPVVDEERISHQKEYNLADFVKIQCTKADGGETFFMSPKQFAAFKDWVAFDMDNVK